MNEYNSFSLSNTKNMCRACLRVTEKIFPMTTLEINAYQRFTDKVSNMQLDMNLCFICKWMLKKCMKFSQQCQKANDILSQTIEMDSNSHLIPQLNSAYDLKINSLAAHYLGPENNLDVNDDQDEYIAMDDHTDVDYDEIPLVMLQDEYKNQRKSVNYETSSEPGIKQEPDIKEEYKQDSSHNVRSKKRKEIKEGFSSRMVQETNKYVVIKLTRDQTNSEPELKQESDIKEEYTHDSSHNVRSKKRKIEIKEGFSSRMVQETDEYVVIKLTRDQVLSELAEKAKAESYIRSPYKCEKCVKGFNFEDVLQTHMGKHTLEHGTYECDICTQYCPSVVSLRGHLKSHTTRYKCKICGQVRLSRQHLLEHHAITHTAAPTTYTCDKCLFSTTKRTVIQRHVKTHAISEQHTCYRCGKLFSTIESLRVHTMRHDKSKRLQCERCDKRFIYPSLLHKHIQAVHERTDYYCVECDVSFKSPESLRLHFKKAKRHRDSSSYKYECPHCSARFVTTATLSVHLTSSHGAPKQHSCESCRRQYSSREALRAHVWRVHSQREKAASCAMCDKTFTRKSILKVHLRSHSGAFAQRAALAAQHGATHQKQEDLRIESPTIPQEG